MDPTQRLELDDPSLTEFSARVVTCEATSEGRHRVVLDRSAFYPTSGGQPHDTGALGVARVVDVRLEGALVVHTIEGDPIAGSVEGRVDPARRRDHRQQHTGQHVLSATFASECGAATASFHLGADHSTIDIDKSADASQIARAESAANAVVERDLLVDVTHVSRDTLALERLRKINVPEGIDIVRVVSIGDVDRSHCGGTHCHRTGEIRLVKVIGTEKSKAGLTRVAFVCGDRALRDYAARFDALALAALAATTAWSDVPAILSAKIAALKESEKGAQRFSAEAAATIAQSLPAGDEPYVRRFEAAPAAFCRALATGLTQRGRRGALVGTASSGAGSVAAVLAFPAGGKDAGEVVRAFIARHPGGRGGGRGPVAQIDGLSPALFDALGAELLTPPGSPS
jgi:alanyl-tRNA synthetase